MYKCRWLITPINFRDAMRGKSRTQRKVGNTGLTYEQIKKQWKTEAVEIARSCRNKKDVYPLLNNVKVIIKINPTWIVNFNISNIIQYAKFPLDALTKANIYNDDSQIIDSTYMIDENLSCAVEITIP